MLHPVTQIQVETWYVTVVEPLQRETAGGDLALAYSDEPRTSREIVSRHFYPNLQQMIQYHPWFAAPVAAYDQAANEALLAGGEVTEPVLEAARWLRGALGDLVGAWTSAGLDVKGARPVEVDWEDAEV